MPDILTVQFGEGSKPFILEFSDGEWKPGSSDKRGYKTVWRIEKRRGRTNRIDTDEVIELSPVAALFFPCLQDIEGSDPKEILARFGKFDYAGASADKAAISDTGGEIPALARLFLELWSRLKDVDSELLEWAARRVATSDVTRLRLLSLFVETEHGILRRTSQGAYVPPPPLRLRDAAKPRGGVKRAIEPSDIVATAFQYESRLSNAMSDFEFRAEQGEMAKHVWDVFANERHLMIEAGTGIGKSLAYLLPAVLLSDSKRTPIVISTNTINLQEQLLSKDVPIAMETLPEYETTVALLKGRTHYFCRMRARDALFGSSDAIRRIDDLSGEYGPALDEACVKLAFFQAQTADGDMDAMAPPSGLTQTAFNRLRSAIDCGSGTCIRQRCRFYDACWFYEARERATKASIVVMNHALLFSLFSAEKNDGETLLSKVHHFILDEAHNLEDVITSQFTAEITGQTMVDFANDLMRIVESGLLAGALSVDESKLAYDDDAGGDDDDDDDDEGARAKIADARAARSRLREPVRAWIAVKRDIDTWAARQLNNKYGVDISLSNPEGDVKNAAKKLEELLTEAKDAFAEVSRYATALLKPVATEKSPIYIADDAFQSEAVSLSQKIADLSRTLDGLTNDSGATVRWAKIAATRDSVTFRCYVCPLEVGEIFRGFLDAQNSVVMTSATLTAGGDFGFLKSRLGVSLLNSDTLECVRLETPFRIMEQAQVIVPTDIPEPDYGAMAPYYDVVARVVGDIATGFRGGTLVLFNSYADLDAVAELTTNRLKRGLKLLKQGSDGSRSALGARMRDEDGIVLFGVRSFWEGFDMPGSALRAVVLTRLPFANFNDPVIKARAAAIRERGGSDFKELSLPQAAMRFAQGFGRLIRSRTDRGCIFVLDTRIVRKQYGRVFLDSLPSHAAQMGKAAEVIPAAIAWYWDGASSDFDFERDIEPAIGHNYASADEGGE